MASAPANVSPQPDAATLRNRMRRHLFVMLALGLVATSPFTVGPAIAAISTGALALQAMLGAWAQQAPLTSWFVAAGLGLALTTCWVACPSGAEMAPYPRLKVASWCGVALGVLTLELLLCSLPSVVTLYDAFVAAGGTPRWLNVIATLVVVAAAYVVHLAAAIAVLFGLAVVAVVMVGE